MFFEIVIYFFKKNISEKTGYFNTRFVFYSVNIQPDIMKNWQKNIWKKSQFFLNDFWNLFLDFFVFLKEIYNIILYILNKYY